MPNPRRAAAERRGSVGRSAPEMDSTQAKRLLRCAAGTPDSPITRALEKMVVEGLESVHEEEAEPFVDEWRAFLQYEAVAEVSAPIRGLARF